MFMRKIVLIAVLVISCLPFAYAADVTGKWTAQFDTQVGLQKYTFEFKAEGANLTGMALGNIAGTDSKSAIQEGKINGDEISFVEIQQYQGQEVRIVYKGKVAGDAIKFTRKVADQFDEELVAKRIK